MSVVLWRLFVSFSNMTSRAWLCVTVCSVTASLLTKGRRKATLKQQILTITRQLPGVTLRPDERPEKRCCHTGVMCNQSAFLCWDSAIRTFPHRPEIMYFVTSKSLIQVLESVSSKMWPQMKFCIPMND